MAKFKKKNKDKTATLPAQDLSIKKNKKVKKLKKLKFEEKPIEESKAKVSEEVLTIDLVKELGGTEDDFSLVENIGENDEDADLDNDTESELKSLIQSLNFSKFKAADFIIKDEEVVEPNAEKPPQENNEETPKEKKKKEKKSKIVPTVQDNAVSSSSEKIPLDDGEDSDDEKSLLPEHLIKRSEFHFLKDKEVSNRTHSVIKSGEKWFDLINSEGASAVEAQKNKYWVPKLEKYAKSVWEKDTENYTKASMKGSKKSETQWINTVLKSGTLNDKFSAYVILLQENPIHNLPILETLIDFVSLKSRRPCLMAIDTLQQLFLTVLLVPTRKLRSFDRNQFSQLPELTGGNKDTRDRYLITWLYEDRLKKMYLKFVENLEQVGKDSIEKTKVKSISTVFELLAGNPEQEAVLLERLTNKLGDPVRSIAAKAMYHLSQLLEKHPVMKWVVVGEVERLLYRQNISPKAQYYGVCFLSQILLEKHNQDNLAAKLIGIYFSFFKVSIKKGEVDTKLMKALLTGVNRAFPFASLEPAELDAQLETMHKLVHLVSFNTAIQALTLLYQVMDSREAVTDRFYTALYKKVLDPALPTSSKQVMFLNLLYKALKSDPSLHRVKAFIKRLLQICEYQPSHLICGLLFLMSELIRARPELGSMRSVLQEAETVDTEKFEEDSDDEHYEDVKEESDADMESENKTVTSGWTFKATAGNHEAKTSYDPCGRNPLYSGAEKSALWELECLEKHFHPSAALFAKNLLDNEPIKYSGDPLSDFTLTRFLDRFVFRNPKKNPEKNKPTTVLGKRNIYKPAGIKAVAPDSKDFLNRDVENVPIDEMFMYKYFHEKLERKGDKIDDDAGSVTSAEFNNFLDNMGGRANDFDGEDLDFAGGLGDGESKKGEESDGEDDSDGEAPEMDTLANSDEDEPTGLDGEDDENFKDLSSGEEDDEMDLMAGGDDDDEMDEEGFGADDMDEEGFGGDEDDLDEEGFGEDNDDEDKTVSKIKVKPKKVKTKFPKFNPNDLSSLFADAEEFAHLLDENEDDGMATSVSNKDKASKKQLNWEDNRENHMKGGQSWKNKNKGKKVGGGGSKTFSKSKPSFKPMKKKSKK